MVEKEPTFFVELEGLSFYQAKMLAFYEVKTESGFNFVMIVLGERFRSSIIIFDNSMQVRDTSIFDGYKISQVVDTLQDG